MVQWYLITEPKVLGSNPCCVAFITLTIHLMGTRTGYNMEAIIENDLTMLHEFVHRCERNMFKLGYYIIQLLRQVLYMYMYLTWLWTLFGP